MSTLTLAKSGRHEAPNIIAHEVIRTLENSGRDWRTAAGIASDTGLAVEDVQAWLNDNAKSFSIEISGFKFRSSTFYRVRQPKTKAMSLSVATDSKASLDKNILVQSIKVEETEISKKLRTYRLLAQCSSLFMAFSSICAGYIQSSKPVGYNILFTLSVSAVFLSVAAAFWLELLQANLLRTHIVDLEKSLTALEETIDKVNNDKNLLKTQTRI